MIIRGKLYPCIVQCREAASNLGPLGTSGVAYHCARPALLKNLSLSSNKCNQAIQG
uniref:Uncharacterized protein n=1 Tax=Arundo donax TaxID=35708 RepID=A0A0A9FLY2_ARUDO